MENNIIQKLVNIQDEQSHDYSKSVEFLHKHYFNLILSTIYRRYSLISDPENFSQEIFFNIVYSKGAKKAKIKSYDFQKGTFETWLINVIKNACANETQKQTLLAEPRLRENKKNVDKKNLEDILTVRLRDQPIKITRNESISDEEWEKIYKELYNPKPEDIISRKELIDCIQRGLMYFKLKKGFSKNWQALQFILHEKPLQERADELEKNEKNTRVFESESRKKLKPFVKDCFELLESV